MPRRQRPELPEVPLHITHCGVNRCAIFIDDDDRHHYPRLSGLSARQQALAVHAYVLMSNHVHLLTSSSRPGLRRRRCCAAYRKWLHAGEDEEQLRVIRSDLAQQGAYGDERFQAMVEKP